MIIGTFTYDPDNDTYTGALTTLTFRCDNILIKPHKRSPELDFDYRILAETPQDHLFLGQGWHATLPNGQPYVSVHIDDPAFAAPIDAALWRCHTTAAAKLQWLRPKRRLGGFSEWSPFKAHRAKR